MINILGIEHVAIAVENADQPSELFGQILGIQNTGNEEIRDQKVVTRIFDTGQGKVELLEVSGEDSPIAKFLEKRGQGMHHIAFRVENIEEALDHCRTHGIQLIDEKYRIGAEGLKIAFLHPKSTSGVLVELCEKP